MSERADVIVVGGGPAGSSTAWHLARAGARVTVLDRARFPRAKPCSEYLSPEASRLLDAMGVLGACARAGAAELSGMAIRASDGARAIGRFDGAHGFRGYRDRGLALRRTVLDGILLDAARAAGVRVAEGVQVTALLHGAHGEVTGVRTLGEDGAPAERRAALVIGADGLRSIVARRLGLARSAARPRRVAFVSHWRGVRGMGALGEMHVEPDGYCGLASVDDGLTNVAVVVPAAGARAAKGDAAGFLSAWIAARPHLAPRFAGARAVDETMVTGPFAHAVRRAWAPGAALVGDAADFFDPFTGEGIFAALRGGELLAPFAVAALGAASERDARDALAAYDRARHETFGGKWRLERLVAMAVASPVLMRRAVRALAARPELADLLVGVTGDFIPPHAVLSASYVSRLLWHAAVSNPAPTPALP